VEPEEPDVAQIALAALLLIGGSLFAQTYLSRIRVEKGFDSTNPVAISLTVDYPAWKADALVQTRIISAFATALGLAGAVGASQYVESQLFQVSPTDPITYVIVAAFVITGAALASWHPTRTATRVDPAITLRSE